MYKTQSPDTAEAAERAQFDILRRMGRERRWEIGLKMVDEGFSSQWKALERLHPDWTRAQLLVEWVRVHYGEELSVRYADYLQCNSK